MGCVAVMQGSSSCGENITPDRIQRMAEAARHAVLAFMKLLQEFNINEDASGVVELLKTEHRLNSGFNSAMILFDSPYTNDKNGCAHWICSWARRTGSRLRRR